MCFEIGNVQNFAHSQACWCKNVLVVWVPVFCTLLVLRLNTNWQVCQNGTKFKAAIYSLWAPNSAPCAIQRVYRVGHKFSYTWNELFVMNWFISKISEEIPNEKSIIFTLSENFNEIKQTWHQLHPQTSSKVTLYNHILCQFES